MAYALGVPEVNEFGNNDHPDYDDLIRELRELKHFIEGTKTDPGAPTEKKEQHDMHPRGDFANAASADNRLVPPHTNQSAIPPEQEPPMLREVVHRPKKPDEFQLDLLSIQPAEGAIDAKVPSREPAVPANENGLNTSSTSTEPDPTPTGNDEIAQFVSDLSNRILDTFEDRLLERSGELLPDDLRQELHQEVGDILSEWCES